MRSSLNLATKPKESSQCISFKKPSMSYSSQTQRGRGNTRYNYVVLSRIISQTYMTFYNLGQILENKMHIVLGWWDTEVIIHTGALPSVSWTVCISAEQARWLLHLAGQLGYLCSCSPKKCMTYIFNSRQQQLQAGWGFFFFRLQANNKPACQCQRLQDLKMRWLMVPAALYPCRKRQRGAFGCFSMLNDL